MDVTGLVLFAVLLWPTRRKRDAIAGWWHYQHGGRQRWTEHAWRVACRSSLEKSKERRGR